ncbi:ABC transporter permease subunit [Lactococcus cremoris]|uniref:Potential membrane spanning protein n=1 Tax=Lactococcus lactis TaxID=1358 RepID=O87232_9LACT|nr:MULTISPECIES: ABC transporter permease subunit [Lactococcus]AAC56008.1 Potential membrane spanning protein [Lactococcus lactis]MDR9868645.1 ABC transporter permease subunit [Lactococcus cremoris]
MINQYKKEMVKLFKQKSSWAFIIFLIVQNTFVALLSVKYPTHFIPKELFISNYASLSFIPLLIIVKASTIISMEFEYGTLKLLLSKGYSRQKIIISKWLTIFSYSLFLYTLVMFISFINKTIFFSEIKLGDLLVNSHQRVIEYWILTNLTNFLSLWLLLSVVLLITTMLKKSNVAILIGVTGYFILNVFSTVMFGMIKQINILKWNPINLLNFPTQLALPNKIEKLTLLSNSQMVFATLTYIIVFLLIGMLTFSRTELR